MTGRGDAAWLAGLADTLTEVDEFLRTPAGIAALEDFYQARGSIAPGFHAGNLIDAVSFTTLLLRGRAAPQARRS
jgi:hypothetical protein